MIFPQSFSISARAFANAVSTSGAVRDSAAWNILHWLALGEPPAARILGSVTSARVFVNINREMTFTISTS
jgi:hypothetical protein